MPRVSRLEPQKKDPSRYSVYLDDKYSFSLPAGELITSGLHQGQEVSDEVLEQIKNGAARAKRMEAVIRLISFRPRTEKEIRDYLAGKEATTEESDSIIARLKELQMLDDAEFSRRWIATRKALKPRSTLQLKQELRAKGVADETIESAMAEVEPEDEQDAIRRIAAKKLKTGRFNDRRKLTDSLVRQGFKYDFVRDVLDAIGTENDDATDL